MQINTDVYSGRIATGIQSTFRCRDFNGLIPDGYMHWNPDNIDNSIFSNQSPDDTLNVFAWVKLDSIWDGDLENEYMWAFANTAYERTAGNYFPSYTAWENRYISCGEITTIGAERLAPDTSTASQIPEVAPLIEFARSRAVLLVMVEFCQITRHNYKNHSGGYSNVIEFGTMQTMAYDDFINSAYFENDDYIVVSMYTMMYYGTATNKSYENYFDVAFMRHISPCPLIDSNTHADYADMAARRLYGIGTDLHGGMFGDRHLQQGGYFTASSANTTDFVDKNIICCFARCNPSFWEIKSHRDYSVAYDPVEAEDVVTFNDDTFVYAQIKNNQWALSSAFNAYRSTGFLFTGKLSVAESADTDNITDPDLHIGAVDDNGVVNPNIGQSGEDITAPTGYLNNDPANYGDTPYHEDIITDLNNYTDSTPMSTPNLSTVGAFNRTYAITFNQLRSLADWLWNANDTTFETIIKGLGLMGDNPIEGIIDVRLYPFDMIDVLGTGTAETIRIGRTDSPVNGLPINTNQNAVIELGSCTFFEENRNFLDFKPFTEARLYIPYCGIVPIDPSEFAGKRITAKLIVDVVTGACTAVVYADNIIILYQQGVCGISIPFSGTNSAQMAQSIIGNIISGASGIVTSAMTGNVGGAAASSAALGFGLATNFGIPTQYESGGTSSPACGTWSPQYCYFIIDRPIPNPPSNYGHCVGYACEIYDTLNAFYGFTMIANPDLSGILATDREKEEIKSLLQEGVYL